MKMKPTYDRVIVREHATDETTSHGFFLPKDNKETTLTGEVLATGPGAKTKDGTLLPMTIKVGDQVMFPRTLGQKVKADGEEVIILNESDIVAILG